MELTVVLVIVALLLGGLLVPLGANAISISRERRTSRSRISARP
ncbi:MAG: hypothetical protein NTY41_01095 [Proteobacteria bacterium]|nr:hypothetical protein [Pseudomonadota bacterium]